MRVIMATFKNMVLGAPEATIIPMLGHKLLQDVEILSVRKWSDGEIIDDLMFLREELGKHVASLSYVIFSLYVLFFIFCFLFSFFLSW